VSVLFFVAVAAVVVAATAAAAVATGVVIAAAVAVTAARVAAFLAALALLSLVPALILLAFALPASPISSGRVAAVVVGVLVHSYVGVAAPPPVLWVAFPALEVTAGAEAAVLRVVLRLLADA
jgi:hypothetical protein